MNRRIYLDHNAASKVDPRVVEAVECYLRNHTGNPSSVHSFGRECRAILTRAHDGIAKYLGVKSEEILFTSGATEAANFIIRGICAKQKGGHIITTGAEHSCVYNTIKEMEKSGYEVSYLQTGELGAVTQQAIKNAIRPDTKLIAVIAANNETGVKSDIDGIAAIAQDAGIPFFVDAVALLGKESITIPPGVWAMCFSGQKIHALQGSGFCFITKKLKLPPLFFGGGQQYGRRAGTENLPGIVALAKAVELIDKELPHATKKMQQQRDNFEYAIQQQLENVLINGKGPRVANTSNLCFTGVDGETLLTSLDLEGIAASHGSACESGALEPSRVLLDMGIPRDQVNSSIRFSLSRFTTDQEIEDAVNIITRVVTRLRTF